MTDFEVELNYQGYEANTDKLFTLGPDSNQNHLAVIYHD